MQWSECPGHHPRVERGRHARSHIRRRAGAVSPITFALGLGVFLIPFDVTAVVVAMPGIATDLGFAIAGSAWVIDAYSLAFTSALLASGVLADRFGRRSSMLAGNVVFLIASIACGMAANGPMLLTARVVQGVGGAFRSPAQSRWPPVHFRTKISGRARLAPSA